MKSIVRFIATLLVVVVIAGGMFALTKEWKEWSESSSEELSESIDVSISDKTDSGGLKPPDSSDSLDGSDKTDSGDTSSPETMPTLSDPSNKSAFMQDGITMVKGASLYIGEAEPGPDLRFTFNVSAEVRAEVEGDENKTLSYLIAPLEYFDEVNTGNKTYIDWVTAFKEANKAVMYTEIDLSNYDVSDNIDVYIRLNNVKYQNTNRAFVCMLVFATKTGNVMNYRYNGYESGVNYRNNARSVAYVASSSLNANALGLQTFNEEALTKLKSYINSSVDYANGLAEATDDNSTYDFQLKTSMRNNIQIGEKFSITTTITPDVDVPVWYRSLDESVATVDDDGVVTIVGKGTTVIRVYVAGKAKGVTVTIE